MPQDIFFDDTFFFEEDEELFARDEDGQLMRLVEMTAKDHEEEFEVIVDGESVRMKKAVPLTDSQGNNREDNEGNTIFRRTTIWDAAQERYQSGRNPIPTLCHLEHLVPTGVCRICTVQTFRIVHGLRTEHARKLLPACVHPCEPNMEVHTVESPEKEIAETVRKAVRTLTEMLCIDHLQAKPNPTVQNELKELKDRLECSPGRFSRNRPLDRPVDRSNRKMIQVNHNACILCDRCTRSCSEVKENFTIGRSGVGYTTHIAFDLNEPLDDSGCVSCGECMIYCPTEALTFVEPVKSEWWDREISEGAHAVSAEELRKIRLFESISYKFLQWNAGAVVRKLVSKGDVLCRQGDYGATAFILRQGKFGIHIGQPKKIRRKSTGVFSDILNRFSRSRQGGDTQYEIHPLPHGNLVATRGPEDVILGEMTCMSSYPRNATIIALTDGEILEIRRNVLYMLQRNVKAREILDEVYQERALETHLATVSFFEGLNDVQRTRCIAFLKDRVRLVRLDPDQVIFQPGERANAFYMVRIGHVKVSRIVRGEERILDYLRPNSYFGEIGLVSDSIIGMPQSILGRRTARCTALDNVELVKIDAKVFEQLLQMFPLLRSKVVRESQKRLDENQGRLQRQIAPPLSEFIDQGLYNAQKLLVLDLESCTRCDECSNACSDTHQGVTRLIREGLRFDRYLIASACRTCTDPYCLVGCPVDAIHREGSLNISIQDHCIGCGECQKKCPYGNINMVESSDQSPDKKEKAAVREMEATTCDLCQSIPAVANHPETEVYCVYACPHDAAFRMSGQELYKRVTGHPMP